MILAFTSNSSIPPTRPPSSRQARSEGTLLAASVKEHLISSCWPAAGMAGCCGGREPEWKDHQSVAFDPVTRAGPGHGSCRVPAGQPQLARNSSRVGSRSRVAGWPLGGAVLGIISGWALSFVIVKILTGVFDPPPPHLFIPWGYLAALTAVTAGAIAWAGVSVIRTARKPAIEVIRDL